MLGDPHAIIPRGPVDAEVVVPGSKSISNRALLLAGLAEGSSTLRGVLDSDDTQVMARALAAMGVAVHMDGHDWTVSGVGGRPSAVDGPIDVHASGTAARFLTAAAALVPGSTTIDGTERMRQRPIDDLVQAMGQLDMRATILGNAGCPPVRVEGGHPFGGTASVDASRSSQYVSALLLVAPYASRPVRLELLAGKLVSRPYVDVTLSTMADFGADARWDGEGALVVSTGSTYRGRDYIIEPDASTAAYFFAATAICGGRVRVPGLGSGSGQADTAMLGVLEKMGCQVKRGPTATELTRGELELQAVDVDMCDMPDAVLAVAVTALFARGTTHIRNVANLRIKESDRLAALETELCKLGAEAHADADSLTITPGPLRGASIATYDDHRMAMAFGLAGLAIEGVQIQDPTCVSKSWPQYFDALAQL